MGIPVRARVGPPLGRVPFELFGYFLRGTRPNHFTCGPRIRPSPVKKPRFPEFVVPPVFGVENLPSKKCREPKSLSFTAHFFAEKEVSAWLCPTHEILLPKHLQRLEDLGPEPRNLGQENFIGRKIFRRLTSPLAATLQPVRFLESEER